MTVFRLPFSIFKKHHSFVRLWARHTACTLCASRRQCVAPTDLQSNAAFYSTRVRGAFYINPTGGLRLHPENLLGFPIRLKSDKSSKKYKKRTLEEDDDDYDGDDDDDSKKENFEDEAEEDPNLPKDYKDIAAAVQSFRYDVIMKAGLDIARHKVEEAFYDNQLRLNGEKLWKKSRTVKVGDTLDLIVEQDKAVELVTVMRVIVKKVAEEKTKSEKFKVWLRRWKNLKLPKQDVLK